MWLISVNNIILGESDRSCVGSPLRSYFRGALCAPLTTCLLAFKNLVAPLLDAHRQPTTLHGERLRLCGAAVARLLLSRLVGAATGAATVHVATTCHVRPPPGCTATGAAPQLGNHLSREDATRLATGAATVATTCHVRPPPGTATVNYQGRAVSRGVMWIQPVV